MKTFVYFNLHKKVWSLRVKGLVKGHSKAVVVANVDFKVSEAGRRRTVALRKKFVHAGIQGEVVNSVLDEDLTRLVLAGYREMFGEGVSVSYNPFKGPKFFRRDNGQAVDGALAVVMLPNRDVIAFGVR